MALPSLTVTEIYKSKIKKWSKIRLIAIGFWKSIKFNLRPTGIVYSLVNCSHPQLCDQCCCNFVACRFYKNSFMLTGMYYAAFSLARTIVRTPIYGVTVLCKHRYNIYSVTWNSDYFSASVYLIASTGK